MYESCEYGGWQVANGQSLTSSPSSSYKLQCPLENRGVATRVLWLWTGVGGWRSKILCPVRSEDPMVVKWTRGHSAAAGRSHTGPLGLHLVALATSSPAPTAGLGLKERKQAFEKCWSSEAGRGSGAGSSPNLVSLEGKWSLSGRHGFV